MIWTKEVFIDFDGPIHRYSKGYYDGTIYDPPTENVKQVIDLLKKKYNVVVFTARVSQMAAEELGKSTDEIKEEIAEWMNEHGIPFDDITCEKRPAVMYIDDLAIHFDTKGGWKTTLKDVLEFLQENG